MNPFTTDHPLASEPFRFSRRTRRLLYFAVIAYPAYLLLLGPFYGLNGRGCLSFIPERVRNVLYFPAAPIYRLAGPNNFYDDYLNCWYADLIKPETTW
jgi:hypothetical protein